MARLFGDADGQWVSRSWMLQYKIHSGDSWKTAFSNVNAFFNDWSTQQLDVTARYVRVTVFGDPDIPATQARELEIYGTPFTDIPNPTYPCSDKIDNDGDGFIDYPDDPGCTSTADDEINVRLSNSSNEE